MPTDFGSELELAKNFLSDFAMKPFENAHLVEHIHSSILIQQNANDLRMARATGVQER